MAMGRQRRASALGAAVCLACLTAGVPGAAVVRRSGAEWTLENDAIKVAVECRSGQISVVDKRCGYTWNQPPRDEVRSPGAVVALRRWATPPRIDGDLGEWKREPDARITHEMTADAKAVDSDDDCSSEVRAGWDQRALYLGVTVRDVDATFGAAGLSRWWDKDSVEVWVGSRQVGLSLSPAGSGVRSASAALPGGEVVLAARADGSGYSVEAVLPWSLFGREGGVLGDRLPFAIGVNDADGGGEREGQIYFPATWQHSRPQTFAEAVLADGAGRAPPKQDAVTDVFRHAERVPQPPGIRFRTNARSGAAGHEVVVTMTLAGDAPDLAVEIDMADRGVAPGRFVALGPFVLDTPGAALAVADYCNGHMYPLGMDPFPRTHFVANRLDMPWVGVTDTHRGHGYLLLVETSDDCAVAMRQCRVGERAVRAPQVEWWPSRGTFRYARKFLYSFSATGGHVPLAKRYRAYARENGLLVTLAEKVRRNPNVRRLFGAPDLWGNASLGFAREAKALGVDRMLIHGQSSAGDMQAINELGYLSSRYDNYTDILPLEEGKGVSSNRGVLPDHAVLMANGERKKAWLTFDKQTQYMKRCPGLWVDAARKAIPEELERLPFLGRFIDVTTAEGLYECFDPGHPLTHTAKRECGVALEEYVESLGLVVGGEHGIWWGVPHMSYIEGMMSGGSYSWPAGHLKHPKTKDEAFDSPWGNKYPGFERYEELGIGHEYRVPLWELVFHDCIVSTWYWGDASDWLLEAAPEITPKKDAFNVLYCTIPLLWANAEGSWVKDREAFLRTYRNTCKLHEQTAGEEMLTHEFVTRDHAVQRTRFSGETEVVVNFGLDPRRVELKREAFLLPQNGFVVRGPKVQQSLCLEDGRPVTRIKTPGYLYSDEGGCGVTMRVAGPGRILAVVGPTAEQVAVRPARLVEDWDLASTVVYELDSEGVRQNGADWAVLGDALTAGPFPAGGRFELLSGAGAREPDLAVAGDGLRLAQSKVKQGETLRLRLTVRNLGLGDAAATVEVYADRAGDDFRLATASQRVEGGSRAVFELSVPTDRLDGSRTMLASVRTADGSPELCSRNNSAVASVEVLPEWSLWPHRVLVDVESGPVDRFDEPVCLAVDLAELAVRAGLDGPVDVSSLRVAACDAAGATADLVPSQFDAVPGFDPATNAKGELCWLLRGRTPKGLTRRFVILLRSGSGLLLPHAGSAWNDEARSVGAAGYVARFSPEMVLASLAPRTDTGVGPDFLESIILSWKDTGWVEEEAATIEEAGVLTAGPVRTTVRVRKALKAGVVYEKVYRFYPRRFDVVIDVNKPAGGLYSRAHYRLPGRYVDDGGTTADIDGDGAENRETYGKSKNPRWYAALGTGWAHSCVAVGAFDHVAYWDGGHMGAIGFVGGRHEDVRMSYVIHGERPDASFAETDWLRVMEPVKVRLGE